MAREAGAEVWYDLYFTLLSESVHVSVTALQREANQISQGEVIVGPGEGDSSLALLLCADFLVEAAFQVDRVVSAGRNMDRLDSEHISLVSDLLRHAQGTNRDAWALYLAAVDAIKNSRRQGPNPSV